MRSTVNYKKIETAKVKVDVKIFIRFRLHQALCMSKNLPPLRKTLSYKSNVFINKYDGYQLFNLHANFCHCKSLTSMVLFRCQAECASVERGHGSSINIKSRCVGAASRVLNVIMAFSPVLSQKHVYSNKWVCVLRKIIVMLPVRVATSI